MFTDLAFIDWVALVFSSVLLAAAAVSALLAYATGKSRQGPLLRLPDGARLWAPEAFGVSGPRTPEHATISLSKPLRTSSVGAHAAVTSNDVAPSTEPVLDEDEKTSDVAARAARLAGRPVQDRPPAATQVVAEAETLVHGSSLVLTGDRPRPREKRADVKLVEGFKARTPGFFEDPVGRHELRYWDGQKWTEYVKEHGERFTDPL